MDKWMNYYTMIYVKKKKSIFLNTLIKKIFFLIKLHYYIITSTNTRTKLKLSKQEYGEVQPSRTSNNIFVINVSNNILEGQ